MQPSHLPIHCSHSSTYVCLLTLTLSWLLSIQQYDYNYTHSKVIALSHIYTYMNLGVFTNIASIGLLKTYLQICLSSGSHCVLFIHHRVPSRETDFPTLGTIVAM